MAINNNNDEKKYVRRLIRLDESTAKNLRVLQTPLHLKFYPPPIAVWEKRYNTKIETEGKFLCK